jgi:hypothetical protein
LDGTKVAKPKPSKDPKPGTTRYRSSKAAGVRYRSAKTGRFVTEKHAKRHSATTIKETRKRK